MFKKKVNKAQATLEYVAVIVLVAGALIVMQIYLKRGAQGKLRESTDQIGEQFDVNHTSGWRQTIRSGVTVQTVTGGVTTSNTTSDTTTDSGNETVAAWK